MKKLILSVIILGGLFTGCKKKNDDPAPATSSQKVELLTAHTWFFIGATADKPVDYDGDGTSSLDLYSQMDRCEKDDFLNFSNSNDTKLVTSNDGATSCYGTPSSEDFEWNLNASETILSISYTSGSQTSTINFTLIEVSATTLKYSFTTKDINNVSYVRTEIYSKNEPVLSSKSKTELITAHSWIVIAATADKPMDYDGDGISSTNVYSQYADCDKDDFINFNIVNSIKSGTLNDGANSCYGDPNATYPFTWTFNSNETIVQLISNGNTNNATIIELTDTRLKISYETEDYNGLSYTQTDTYAKK